MGGVADVHPTGAVFLMMVHIHFRSNNMSVLIAIWQVFGLAALFAHTREKRSIFGQCFAELLAAKDAGEILMGLFQLVFASCCVYALGPITLIRFVM